MNNDIIGWITILCTIVIAIITPTGELYNKVKKKVTGRYWIVIAFTILSVILQFVKELNDNTEKNNERRQAKDLQKSRDSIAAVIQKQRDSLADIKRQESNNELTKSFGEAIGKYKLEFDTVKNEIKDFKKDTIKNKIDPDFTLSVDTSFKLIDFRYNDFNKNSLYHFEVHITNYKAQATNARMKIYFVGVNDKNEFVLADSAEYFKQTISENESYRLQVSLITKGRFSKIFYFVSRSFSNSDNSKPFHFNTVHIYDVYRNEIGIPNFYIERNVRDFLKSKGIK